VRALLLDNRDSFVWNLAQALGALGAEPVVVRTDDADLEDLVALRPDRVVVSPGPCGPAEAGVSVEAVRRFAAGGVPVLGVCLGHQCLGVAFGATVDRAPRPVHGRDDEVRHDGAGCLRGLPSPLRAARYHSLRVSDEGLPAALRVTARTPDGVIMGLRHERLPAEGLQFHPESFLTPLGPAILRNFLEGPIP
jgi:anthranilate synthase/aminodeoxychorismate synthase-like glutamine amidotransferase